MGTSFWRNATGLAVVFGLLPALTLAAIYGTTELTPTNQLSVPWQQRARSVAVLAPKVFISPAKRQGFYQLFVEPLTENWALCPEQPLAQDPSLIVACTGFLVAPNILVTAGHCMLNHGKVENQVTPHCSGFNWVFDFAKDNSGQAPWDAIPGENIAECDRVIYAVHDDEPIPGSSYSADFAIVKLKRPMNRPTLRLSRRWPHLKEPLRMIGHPMGAPRVSTTGEVLSLEPSHFRTNLDAFGGNSGSPVMATDGSVLGLLIRGNPDSTYSVQRPTGRCDVINHCSNDATTCERDIGALDELYGEHIYPAAEIRKYLIKPEP